MTNQDRATRLTRGEIKAFRKSQGWGAAQLGRELANGLPRGYGRSYIANIESGIMPVSRFFAERFKILRARVIGEQVQSKNILMRGRFPKRLVIASKAKRCDVCGWSFIGAPGQKRCGPVCAKIARQRAKSRKAVKA